jgi:hypothetical protein
VNRRPERPLSFQLRTSLERTAAEISCLREFVTFIWGHVSAGSRWTPFFGRGSVHGMVMGRWVRLGVVGIAFIALPEGCGGKVAGVAPSTTGDGGATGSGGATGNGPAASADSGAGGRSSVPADVPAERARACKLYFTTRFSSSCSGPEPPPSELSRLASIFEQSCVGEFDMRGNANTAEALEACANALRITDCSERFNPPRECDFRGSLPAGEPCILGTQCQSGTCNGTTSGYIEQAGVDTCGTCAAVARVGEPCSEACEKGASCVSANPHDTQSRSVCRAVTEVDLAEPCADETHSCKAGLYCNVSRSVCEKLPALDERCPSDLCAPPLVCHRGQVTEFVVANTTCGPVGNAGDSCDGIGDRGCASGLGCVWDRRNSTNRCLPLTWVGPGGVCDNTRRCLVGDCNRPDLGPLDNQPGTCPKTVPDGQPCTSDNECDTLSHCLNPTAPPGVATGICGSKTRVVCTR